MYSNITGVKKQKEMPGQAPLPALYGNGEFVLFYLPSFFEHPMIETNYSMTGVPESRLKGE
jgi:hypothetical protein